MLNDMKGILGDSAESNEKYQKAKAKFDKEEAKAKKLEGRRGLLQRFKEKIPGTAAREAAKARDGDKQGGIFGKGFKSIGKLFAKFTAIFSLALLGLVALVNSPIFEKIKNALLDFVDFFADKVYPILLKAKDQLMGPLKKLYDDFIKPLFTFIGDFLTRDGGGIDTLFEGFEKALEELMKIFKNVKDIFTGITEGDFSKVFNAVGDLLDNIVIALKDALGTAIKFILGFFKVDGKGKTGFQMLGGVVSNFFKSIAEGVGNLFKKVFEKGIKVIFSSNIKIHNLYKDGLQRDQFIPSIKIMKKMCHEENLIIKGDYRKSQKNKNERYLFPLNEKANFAINKSFRLLTKNKIKKEISLLIKGRKFTINNFYEGIARFDFKDLCNKNLGAEDYIKIAKKCDFMIVEKIPNSDDRNLNQQQRFITLVDIVYENNVKLLVSAASKLDKLTSSNRLNEPFKRTLSRLHELTSS